MEPDELEARLRDTFDRWNRGDYAVRPGTIDPDVEIISAAGLLTRVDEAREIAARA